MTVSSVMEAVGDRPAWWRIGSLERAKSATRTRRRQPRPRGLLDSRCPWNADAIRVATAAPQQFGRLSDLYLRAQRVLQERDRESLEEAIRDGLRVSAGACTDKNTLSTDHLKVLDERVACAAQFVRHREGEIARRRYASGLLSGVALSGAGLVVGSLVAMVFIKVWLAATTPGAGVTGWWAQPIPADQALALRDAIVALAGGAAGACVSVLLRLHRVTDLSIEAVDAGIARYRIFLGLFFAAAVLFLVKGGVLAAVINDPTTGLDGTRGADHALVVSSWFFWGAVGFLAGFNERWATTLIARGPGDSADKKPTPTPTPGRPTDSVGSPAKAKSSDAPA